ncbi:MAG: CRTAC1 family protein [Planctomycetaceae bacterium]|jgi:enediyne biosynthesis protein E4|nr:CRTAC1 family protein [Planctomycetaceae bacterium]MBT6156393.1 CRTAC1 family protein [Planctomycetaceae bacterium]MBT6487993.1 CRTAC1 family protein [Planctomycetaceae bacterium]MBT6495274.1 CRTAC1 family protein [Planctomycetaceae bacterium]
MQSKFLLVVLGVSCATAVAAADTPSFDDATERSGIRFKHVSPLTPERHIHLVMGSGIGWIDFDRDDLPDLYLAQGVPFGQAERKQFQARSETSDRLYRNLGQGRFDDITEVAGLSDIDYSMGISVGDFDNDGFQDIYVTNFGRNRLLQNNGDGTFSEIAAVAGVDDSAYGSSCTWVDLDADGNLDLFVCNYLKLDANKYKLCTVGYNGRRFAISCHPRYVPAARDVVFHNEGDGSFTDWTQSAGLTTSPAAQGLGVIAADLDADGDIDIYVANDSVPNDLWINRGGGKFVNEGLLSGTALNRKGLREAGMGVAVGDVDGDGRPDLFVTNYYGETNTLYRNEGAAFFLDVTNEFGLAGPSRLRLGFGDSLFDFDNDGWLDLFVANGHVHDRQKLIGRDELYAQQPQLFRNQTGRRFVDVSKSGGAYFQRNVVGRSSAVADYDRDGKADLAVGHLDSKFVLLHNASQASGKPQTNGMKSLRIELIGVRGNRDAIGAVVEVRNGKQRLTRFRTASAGYLSCDEGALTIGIGKTNAPVDITVRWPGGSRETFRSLQTGQRHVLIEGSQESN